MRLRGDRLRELRESRGYSREKLAELLQIGTNPVYLYESEKSDPSSAVVASIAKLFGVSTDYLMGFIDDPSPRFSDNSLTEIERTVVTALRQGHKMAAIRVIANDE